MENRRGAALSSGRSLEVRGGAGRDGQSRRNPRIYYNVNQRELASNVIADAFVMLKTFDPEATPALLDAWRRTFDAHPGAKHPGEGDGERSHRWRPVAIRVRGPEVEGVRKIAAELEDVMRAVPARATSVIPRGDAHRPQVEVDDSKAALLGIAPGTVTEWCASRSRARRPAFLDTDGESLSDRPRLPLDARHGPDVLDRIYVPTATGAAAPLAQLATLSFEASPARIDRFDRLRAATVTAYPATGYLTSNRRTRSSLALLDLPPGFPNADRRPDRGRARALRRHGQRCAGRDLRHLRGADPGVPLVQDLGDRRQRHSLGILGGILGLYVSGYDLVHCDDRHDRAGRHRIKNSILLVDFHQPAARPGHAAARGDRAGGRGALPADPPDLGDGDRRHDAAGGAGFGLIRRSPA